jgi:hypothetical protein
MTRLGFKHCGWCGQDKPLHEFYVNKSFDRYHQTSHHPGCKVCRRAMAKRQGPEAYRRKLERKANAS